METLENQPVFGPPIVAAKSIEPADRPLAVALVLDLSTAMYNTHRVIDIFKKSLVSRFSNMEYDNVLLLAGNWYEDPGSAVAAIHSYAAPVRNLPAAIAEAVKQLGTLDRFYRRRMLLVTDQFSASDVHAMNVAIDRNATKLMDIEFHAVGYGPQYSRQLDECGWNFRHLDEPTELDFILTEVCK